MNPDPAHPGRVKLLIDGVTHLYNPSDHGTMACGLLVYEYGRTLSGLMTMFTEATDLDANCMSCLVAMARK